MLHGECMSTTESTLPCVFWLQLVASTKAEVEGLKAREKASRLQVEEVS